MYWELERLTLDILIAASRLSFTIGLPCETGRVMKRGYVFFFYGPREIVTIGKARCSTKLRLFSLQCKPWTPPPEIGVLRC